MRDQLLEKLASQELHTKLFEVPNIQLAAALTTARVWETARCQANHVAGGEGQTSVNLVRKNESKEKVKQSRHKQVLCVWEARTFFS